MELSHDIAVGEQLEILKEELKRLKLERDSLLEMINGLNAEKIALDQLLVESLKHSLSSKKDIVLLNQKVEELKKVNDNYRA